MVLNDGAFHAVDSSELAFRMAAMGAFREVYSSAKPIILEPIMKVEVVAPGEFQSISFLLRPWHETDYYLKTRLLAA